MLPPCRVIMVIMAGIMHHCFFASVIALVTPAGVLKSALTHYIFYSKTTIHSLTAYICWSFTGVSVMTRSRMINYWMPN
jgi:hypothetical protein